MKQYVSDDTFAKQSIIGQPALQPTLAISAYIRQFLLTPILPWPAIDFLPNPLGRFLADSGNEIQSLPALFCLYPAWPERVTEKIKGYSIVAGFVPATFAVCDLCLDRMERQAALVESVIEQRLQPFGLSLAGAVTYNVIGIPLELNASPVPFHP